MERARCSGGQGTPALEEIADILTLDGDTDPIGTRRSKAIASSPNQPKPYASSPPTATTPPPRQNRPHRKTPTRIPMRTPT